MRMTRPAVRILLLTLFLQSLLGCPLSRSQHGTTNQRRPRGVKPILEEARANLKFNKNQSAGLFVGVNQFKDSRFAWLRYAVDDAVDLAHLFSFDLGLIHPGSIVLSLAGEPYKSDTRERLQDLIDAGAEIVPANLTDIYSQLEALVGKARQDGLLVLGVSTHGSGRPGSGFLVASDSRYQRFVSSGRTAISVDDVIDDVSRAGSPRRLVLLDACRERLGRGTRDTQATGSPMEKGLADAISHASGQVILFCTTENGYCYEDGQRHNGVFTGAILDGLRGQADATDQGLITADTLADFAHRRVYSWVLEHRPDHRELSRGVHWKMDGEARDLPLAAGEASPPPDRTLPTQTVTPRPRIVITHLNGIRVKDGRVGPLPRQPEDEYIHPWIRFKIQNPASHPLDTFVVAAYVGRVDDRLGRMRFDNRVGLPKVPSVDSQEIQVNLSDFAVPESGMEYRIVVALLEDPSLRLRQRSFIHTKSSLRDRCPPSFKNSCLDGVVYERR